MPDIIERDLDLVILEKEYPVLKNALSMRYSEIGYDEIKKAINEISSHTFTASRLVARAQERFYRFVEGTYDPAMAGFKKKAIKALEEEWKEENRKATLTEKRI